MTGSIWLITYDVAVGDEARYLDWFHDVHIPEKLARPGYNWAAHYEVISPDGQVASLHGGEAREARGFLAIFGADDSRVFLNPSPTQIKPNQPPLTREMMGCRVGSQSLIAAAEWRVERDDGVAPSYTFIDLSVCDAGEADEDYGAWCVQTFLPYARTLDGFDVATKMLSTTQSPKHIMIASFASLEEIQTYRSQVPDDDWSKRVRGYQMHACGSPAMGRRISPV